VWRLRQTKSGKAGELKQRRGGCSAERGRERSGFSKSIQLVDRQKECPQSPKRVRSQREIKTPNGNKGSGCAKVK